MRRWRLIAELIVRYIWYVTKWVPLVYILGINWDELAEMEANFNSLELLSYKIDRS